mmetsp:Transcript_59567/g.191680  ORF Transcript_59567/g.191680 Transcript_59567/m.191680 type:complete len:363 (-) Transcript_59567:967-2055(-)
MAEWTRVSSRRPGPPRRSAQDCDEFGGPQPTSGAAPDSSAQDCERLTWCGLRGGCLQDDAGEGCGGSLLEGHGLLQIEPVGERSRAEKTLSSRIELPRWSKTGPMLSTHLLSSFARTAWRRPWMPSESAWCLRRSRSSASPCCFTSPFTRARPLSSASKRSKHKPCTSSCFASPRCWKAASRLRRRLQMSSLLSSTRSWSFFPKLSRSLRSEATALRAPSRCSSSTRASETRPLTSPSRTLSESATRCTSAASEPCAASPPCLHWACTSRNTSAFASARASATACETMLRSNSSPSARPSTCARSQPRARSSSRAARHSSRRPLRRSPSRASSCGPCCSLAWASTRSAAARCHSCRSSSVTL